MLALVAGLVLGSASARADMIFVSLYRSAYTQAQIIDYFGNPADPGIPVLREDYQSASSGTQGMFNGMVQSELTGTSLLSPTDRASSQMQVEYESLVTPELFSFATVDSWTIATNAVSLDPGGSTGFQLSMLFLLDEATPYAMTLTGGTTIATHFALFGSPIPPLVDLRTDSVARTVEHTGVLAPGFYRVLAEYDFTAAGEGSDTTSFRFEFNPQGGNPDPATVPDKGNTLRFLITPLLALLFRARRGETTSA